MVGSSDASAAPLSEPSSSVSSATVTLCASSSGSATLSRCSQKTAKALSKTAMSSGRRTRVDRPAQYTAERSSTPTNASAFIKVRTESRGAGISSERNTRANPTASWSADDSTVWDMIIRARDRGRRLVAQSRQSRDRERGFGLRGTSGLCQEFARQQFRRSV